MSPSFAVPKIAPATGTETGEQEIEQDFRQLQRFDDFSVQFAEIIALMRHLVRIDPTHAPKYLEEALKKVSPDPREIQTHSGALSAQIYAARVEAVTGMVSGVGKVMASSLKGHQAAFEKDQKLAEAASDQAAAWASLDADVEFLRKMNQEIIEMTKRLQSEIARTPPPRPYAN